MAKQLTVHNATVTTAAVEVKTLTISGKQVTLAVFRQLREENLIGEDGNFLGEPWGYVNYHPDKCADEKEHLHVVWQRDGDLLRSKVMAPWAACHEHPAAGLYAESVIAEGLTLGASTEYGLRVNASVRGDFEPYAWLTYKGVLFQGKVRPTFVRAFQGQLSTSIAHAEMSAICGEGWEAREVLDQLPAAEYQRSWRLVNELPQLFIAV